LQYNINQQENFQTTIDVTLEPEEAKPKYDSVLDEYRKGIKLEGFRKGKVPTSLIKKMYGKEIQAEAFRDFMQESWEKILQENDFDIITDPKIQNINYDDKNGFSYQIKFDVAPDFELTNYEGMPVEADVYYISDEDVDKFLDNLRQRQAMLYTVEGEAEPGHYLNADLYEVDESGVPLLGKKIEDQQIWLKEDDEELTPQLTGVKAGEERRITLSVPEQPSETVETLPENDSTEQYYQVKVKEVKDRRLPELDDEFAKDVGEFETLDELRDQVRKSLEQQAEKTNTNNIESALVDELVKRHNFSVPPVMLENYLDDIVERVKKDQKETEQEVDEAEIRQHFRTNAIHTIKWHFISDKLIQQEQIDVSDDELEQRLKEMEASENDAQRAQKAREDDSEKEKVKNELVYDKLFERLEEKADITEHRKSWYEHDESESAEQELAAEENSNQETN